jgi:hypothetical protein
MKKDFDWSPDEEALEHFGVKGMRWGVSRQAFRDRQKNRIKRGNELNKKKAPITRSVGRSAGGVATTIGAGALVLTAAAMATPVGMILASPVVAGVMISGQTAVTAALVAGTYKTTSQARASLSAKKAKRQIEKARKK